MREFTPLAVILGILIGVLFGAAAAFIGLKVGMTISASIPAAVISMGVLRGVLRRGTLLENNMVQTIASSGESLAAGMIFTIPALYIFGFDVALTEMMLWGAIGGLLGVLFMVPLRRVLIVKEHGVLPYPEGVACAEVLRSGDSGGGGAAAVFRGLGVAALYQLFRGLGFWQDKVRLDIPQARTAFGLDASPALLGVGFILGPRIAGYMLGGAVLGWFVIIPAIAFFGADSPVPIFPSDTLIREMGPDDMWEFYLRYVGAGAVVLGGLLSLLKSTPTIVSSMWHMVGGMFGRSRLSGERTDRDLPVPLLAVLILGLGYAMVHFDAIRLGTWGAIAVLVFGFFFVTVSSRLVGLVGSSSNPASGMTIATLLGTAVLFVYGLHLNDDAAKFTVVSVGALVCVAICIAGDCSQDLKTGYLVQATPWKQQLGEMIGVLSATAAIAWVIFAVKDTYGYVKTPETPMPVIAAQANIMKLLVEGIMDGTLPWILIVVGMAVTVVVELLGIPALPVAVGLYLPLELSAPIMVGGIVCWIISRLRHKDPQGDNPGILAASGMVAGEGLVGVAMVGASAFIGWWWGDPLFDNPVSGHAERVLPHHLTPWLSEQLGIPVNYGLGPIGSGLLPAIPFGLLVAYLFLAAWKRGPQTRPPLPPPGRGDVRSVVMPVPLTEGDIELNEPLLSETPLIDLAEEDVDRQEPPDPS